MSNLIIHRDCGGEIEESSTVFYRYCSEHGGDCDTEICTRAQNIPAIFCSKCKQEILGDAQLILRNES